MTVSQPHPPPGVGRMVNQPVPDRLLPVGSWVKLPDGTLGQVQSYEYYAAHQRTFPVKIGSQTFRFTREDVEKA